MLCADFLSGRFGNPQAMDVEDTARLKAIRQGIDEHLDVLMAQDTFRRQPWCERIPPGSLQDIEMTTQQIASDVARLHDIQKQDPALLHSSIDSLHDSWQQLDLLLEPHAKTFADVVRRSRGFTPQGKQ
jgi:hypothetical protein